MKGGYKLTELVNDDNTEIKYIYHLSDIHIRNIHRHDEYIQVFEKTYETIKRESKGKEDKSIIVLTGDIMHSKTELSPDANNIAYHFFKNLSNILPVILIAGNHDCIVTNQDRLDALTPIIDNCIGLKKIYYLKTTGFYQYHNIIFGFTDMFTDEPLLGQNITEKKLKTIKQKNKYKIALYHGQIRGSKTDLGYEIKSNKFRAKDFRGYDYGLFGDIHKFQYINEKNTMAYAGSLIQQNHGETLNNHGVLKWNLVTGKSRLIEIPNDYGYCKVNVINGKIIDKIIPKTPRINFILTDTTQLQFEEIKDKIKKIYNVCEITSENKIIPIISDKNENEEIYMETNHSEFIKTYLDKRIINEKVRDKIYNLHEKIYGKITNKDLDTDIGGQHWKLIELKFSNIFSYGKDNIINLSQYDKNQSIGIVAPNHYGKSSILDIILYCLFEKSSRGIARDIMNKNENTMSCSLLFSIGENKYLIERTARRAKTARRSELTVNFTLIKPNGKYKNLNEINKDKTNKSIIKLIGAYNDYLTSYICTQDQENNGNFMNKTNSKKKEYLYEILKLNLFDECFNYATDKLKKFKADIARLEKEINRIPIKKLTKQINQLKKNINKSKLEKIKVENLLELITIALNNIETPKLVEYNELKNYNLGTEKDINNNINKLKAKIESININKISNNKTECKNKIITLKHENNGNNNNISYYDEENRKLYDEIINIPIKINNIDIDTLVKNKNTYEKQLLKIDESLSELNKVIQTVHSVSNKKVNKKEYDKLKIQSKLNAKFAEHVKQTLQFIKLSDVIDNENINKLLELQNNWINNYEIWKTDTNVILNSETYDLAEIKNQKEILITQKDSLTDKINIVNNNIEKFEMYKKQNKKNEDIKEKINNNKNNIKTLINKTNENNNSIIKLKNKIKKYDDILNNYQKYARDIKLLEEYEMLFINYSVQMKRYNKIILEKDILNMDLNNIIQQINMNQNELKHLLKTKNEYHRLVSELKNVQSNKKLYGIYCQLISTNGIPYEILKTMLPKIESCINQVLHNMVNFNIEFIYYNGNKETNVKQTARMINAIDIHLHYHNQKPYSIQLSSGFEKFIIGLAIRIVLCNISKSAKPNFFIIDEGWSCLDTENLSNISNIMTYIKNQFEHVIIISHLEELKNQSDHMITIDRKNIAKENEHSYVNNKISNKNKHSKIIEI